MKLENLIRGKKAVCEKCGQELDELNDPFLDCAKELTDREIEQFEILSYFCEEHDETEELYHCHSDLDEC